MVTHADTEATGLDKAVILLPRTGFVAAAFTALCCLGVSGALWLATPFGATLLTRDSTLQPLLAVALALTAVGSAVLYARTHSRPLALVLTIAASVWTYAALYGPLGGHGGEEHAAEAHAAEGHAAGAHDTHDLMTTSAGSHSGGANTTLLVWLGLAALLIAQVWAARKPSVPGKHAARAGIPSEGATRGTHPPT